MPVASADVLIAGAGLAGLSAAAALRGLYPDLRVVTVSSGVPISTHLMGFSAPVVPGDDAGVLAEDTLRAGGGRSDAGLVSVLASGALDALHRLESLGVAFDRLPDGGYGTVGAVGTRYPRVVHSGTATGVAALKALSCPVVEGRIDTLAVSDGRITGAVLSDGRRYVVRAVVLATGGFCGLWPCATWGPEADGSGIRAAYRSGARLRDLDCVQFEPTVVFRPGASRGFPIITTVLREGAVLRDRHGRLLLEPGVPPPPKRRLAEMIQGCIDRGDGHADGTVTFDFSGVDGASFRRHYPGYESRYRSVSVSPERLVFHVRPAAHTTLGGVWADGSCRSSIEGLFVCGEALGGLHGRDRLGGNAGLETLVFGHEAGCSAGAYAQSAPMGSASSVAGLSPAAVPSGLWSSWRALVGSAVTVCPERGRAERALRELERLPYHSDTAFIRALLASVLSRLSEEVGG